MAAIQRPFPSLRVTPHPGAVPIAVQNWNIVRYFNFYRIAVALAAVIIAVTVRKLPPLGEVSPELFQLASFIYFALGIIAFQTTRMQKPDFETHVIVLAFADITLLTLLMHAS